MRRVKLLSICVVVIFIWLMLFSDNFDLKQYVLIIPFVRLGLLKALNLKKPGEHKIFAS